MKLPVDRFDIEGLTRLYDAQDFAGCHKQARALCERLGHTTPWLHWIQGVCEDIGGNPFAGLTHFKEALSSDPTNHTYLVAVATNLGLFRDLLLRYLQEGANLSQVQRVHHFLAQAGEFSSLHQYLVLRNYVKLECYREASNLLNTYLMANPHDPEALELERLVEEGLARMAS
jgi:hypothetical protein